MQREPRRFIIDGVTCFWMTSNWNKINFNTDILKISGFTQCKPQVGDIVVAEMCDSFMEFEVLAIRDFSDPPDQYFADVKAIKQTMKPRDY
jgi:hypothetical protein